MALARVLSNANNVTTRHAITAPKLSLILWIRTQRPRIRGAIGGVLIGWFLGIGIFGSTLAEPVAPETPPNVERLIPEPDSQLRELYFVEVQFDQPVSGVEAADLEINGTGATNVFEFAPGQLVFSFPQPPDGLVTVGWRTDHGIAGAASGSPFAGGAWRYGLDSEVVSADIGISEFLADNSNTLRDEDGDNSDWIEIRNTSETDINLQGWFLTDDASQPAKWRFPNVALGGGEFMVVFASEKNRTNATGRLHTNFKLSAEGEYLALLSPQTNVVSEFAPVYPPQRPDVSYGRAEGALKTAGYFAQPTPGAANSQRGAGFAPEPGFSRDSGTFTESFALSLWTASSNAVLRYTLNGALPTNSSPRYVDPISITNSVQVRVRAFEEGLLPGPPRTETFILLSNNVTAFTSNLPVLIIHSLGKGAPSASRPTFAHLSVYEPVWGVTSLTNRPTLATRTGIKLRGSSTQGLPKSSYAVELWDEFDTDKDEEVLGLPAESDWVLYAPNQYEPVLIHNPFIHQLSRDMGRYSSRTRFVEVYLNKGSGPISAAQYNGIYVLEEKIKIGPDRVPIDRLKQEHAKAPEVTGGYLLKIDRLDPGDAGLRVGGQVIAYVDPKEREIRLPQRDPQEQFIKTYLTNFGQALNGANWRDPVRGYAAYIDVPAWIDFHVLELLSGNVDAIVLSTYFHKPRDGKIVFGPHWDFDRALGSTDGRDSNPRNWVTGQFFTGWWNRLFRDPDFWQAWIDRYQELRRSHFSRDNMNALIDRLAGEVRQVQPRERQKWRVTLRGGSYQSEVDRMKNWLSNRVEFIDRQLVQPPILSAPGGRVAPGAIVNLAGPTNAVVYFTVDGSDPRSPQGGVSPKAHLFTSPIVIQENVRIIARSHNPAARQTGGPPISSPWSSLVAATFTVQPPPLLLTEVMFHPAAPEPPGAAPASDFEFLELLNVSEAPVNMAGYQLTNGIDFAFTSTGAVTQLAPGQRLLLVKNAAAFRARYPGVPNIAGEFAGTLHNRGQRLSLFGPLMEPVFDFSYSDSWQILADGFGFSLVLANEGVASDALQDSVAWRLSSRIGGSPGEQDPAPPILPYVLINELMPNPSSSTRDALELFNASDVPADLSGWFLTDDFREPKKFRVANGMTVPPKGYVWFKSFAATGASFSFSKFGEGVYLFSADGNGNLTGWVHGFDFGAAENGVSFGRHVTSTGSEVFVAQTAATLGTTNSGPRVGPIVMHEIMMEPELNGSVADASYAYVELRNISAQAAPLFDPRSPENTWSLGGAVEFAFPAGRQLDAQACVVIVGFDPATDAAALARFRSRYGFEGTTLAGPWRGRLSNSGELRLFKPGEPQSGAASATLGVAQILVEQVSFLSANRSNANLAADEKCWQRVDPGRFADDPANWSRALPSPGELDSDGDGLSDRWEVAHGLDAFSAEGNDGSAGDPDHDGFTNTQELRSGTGPLDPASHLALTAAVQGNDEIILSFSGVAGRSYTIEYRDGLRQGSWQPWRAVLPEAASGSAVSDTLSKSNRFYRLVTP